MLATSIQQPRWTTHLANSKAVLVAQMNPRATTTPKPPSTTEAAIHATYPPLTVGKAPHGTLSPKPVWFRTQMTQTLMGVWGLQIC